ncbi:hypothetical protein [Rufibacter roseolus]|uniref:hypothetical protein n=1 Tax=Rufibacter roseolus TaxID=2817375 RepID=UPI001B31653E|nr:hypothetical protein [Rufibacter roseolus]
MKFLLLLFTLLCFNLALGQKKEPYPKGSQAYYLKIADTQHTLATITAATGITTASVGLIMVMSQFGKDSGPNGSGGNGKIMDRGDMLGYLGLGLMVISIPFRISSKINYNKAMSLSFLETISPPLQTGGPASGQIMSIAIKVKLAK